MHTRPHIFMYRHSHTRTQADLTLEGHAARRTTRGGRRGLPLGTPCGQTSIDIVPGGQTCTSIDIVPGGQTCSSIDIVPGGQTCASIDIVPDGQTCLSIDIVPGGQTCTSIDIVPGGQTYTSIDIVPGGQTCASIVTGFRTHCAQGTNTRRATNHVTKQPLNPCRCWKLQTCPGAQSTCRDTSI
jgi:hypothetical protein